MASTRRTLRHCGEAVLLRVTGGRANVWPRCPIRIPTASLHDVAREDSAPSSVLRAKRVDATPLSGCGHLAPSRFRSPRRRTCRTCLGRVAVLCQRRQTGSTPQTRKCKGTQESRQLRDEMSVLLTVQSELTALGKAEVSDVADFRLGLAGSVARRYRGSSLPIAPIKGSRSRHRPNAQRRAIAGGGRREAAGEPGAQTWEVTCGGATKRRLRSSRWTRRRQP